MSDTTGWTKVRAYPDACVDRKRIRGVLYEIAEGVDGFALWHTPHGYTILISTYPEIAAAKRAAHDHARSKE